MSRDVEARDTLAPFSLLWLLPRYLARSTGSPQHSVHVVPKLRPCSFVFYPRNGSALGLSVGVARRFLLENIAEAPESGCLEAYTHRFRGGGVFPRCESLARCKPQASPPWVQRVVGRVRTVVVGACRDHARGRAAEPKYSLPWILS